MLVNFTFNSGVTKTKFWRTVVKIKWIYAVAWPCQHLQMLISQTQVALIRPALFKCRAPPVAGSVIGVHE